MAKKPKVNVFTLNQDKSPANKTTMGESRVDDHVSVQMINNQEGINEMMHKLLHTNPFLYNYKKSDVKITSVEDFYITYKRKTYPLGAVFRNPEYKRSKRKKMIKKGFAIWKNDFLKNKEKLLGTESDKLLVVGEVTTNKISIISFIGMILMFMILSILMFRTGAVWASTRSWIVNINQGVTEAFNVGIVSTIGQVTLYLIIISLFYKVYHNRLINEYRRLKTDSQNIYERSKIKISSEFKKKFKKTRKYYLKVRKNSLSVAVLSIDKTASGDVDFDDVKDITNIYIQKTAEIKKRKQFLKSMKFLTVVLSSMGGVFVIGYVIYSIIKNLF